MSAGTLIERFPTPGSITAVSKARLINDIYETACSSIALPVSEDAAAITMFRLVIAQARSLIQQRNHIEAIAQATLQGNQDYELLRQIPGIGPINALTILADPAPRDTSLRGAMLPQSTTYPALRHARWQS